MTALIIKVSGVALLERSLKRDKPGYAAYARRTSAFLPMPPKRG
jgi:steroid 5-alpha reductase family enzyme